MDILETIKTRRSIRKFTGEVISDDEIEMLLRAGFQAPSSSNLKPTHFIIVKDKKQLETIASNNVYAKMVQQAGCAIIVCGDNNKEKSMGFLIADCSAALQNILLAANGIGLGAVWCGLYPDLELSDPIKTMFDLPDAIVPVGIVAVGYKNEEKEAIDRYDETRVHNEGW